tara:strand:+ start:357 stop:980 length:624 start_codon:yes stop_codon:yes gene_type:complete
MSEIQNIIKDYLWLFKFDNIDNKKLYQSCYEVEQQLKNVFPPIENNKYGCFTSYYHTEYNLFSFPCTELQKLYKNICYSVNKVIDFNEHYYLRCWVNLFEKEKNIDWHSHWEPEFKTYHGFYCVNTEGENKSYTDYKIPGKDLLRIESKNGLCVFGKSDGDQHKSSEWFNEGYRVTIAFDVIPVNVLRKYENFTHKFLHNYIPVYKT